MTFKHVKFQDSPIMRSLERVAQEKGLIKPELLQKQAAVVKKADFTPSSDLMENIFKLCEGMREQGLIKEASELETNYFNYKRAQTLYETTTEKGEDQIHAAHPEGSQQAEGVEGEEATFEDILDQHVKILQKVEKKPSGNLSSTAHILNEVKKALGEDTQDSLAATIKADLATVIKNVSRINTLSANELTFSIQNYEDAIRDLMEDIKIDNLKKIKSWLGGLRHRLDPSGFLHYTTFGAIGLSEDTWKGIQGLLSGAEHAINDAIDKAIDYGANKE